MRIELEHSWPGTHATVSDITLSPDGETLAAAWFEMLVIVRVSTGEVVEQISMGKDRANLTATISRVLFAPSGDLLVAVEERPLQVFAPRDWQPRLTISTHPNIWRLLACSPDGKVLASGNSGGDVLLWDLQTGDLLDRRLLHPGVVSGLEFAADQRSLHVLDSLGTQVQWALPTRRLIPIGFRSRWRFAGLDVVHEATPPNIHVGSGWFAIDPKPASLNKR